MPTMVRIYKILVYKQYPNEFLPLFGNNKCLKSTKLSPHEIIDFSSFFFALTSESFRMFCVYTETHRILFSALPKKKHNRIYKIIFQQKPSTSVSVMGFLSAHHVSRYCWRFFYIFGIISKHRLDTFMVAWKNMCIIWE